MTRSQHISAFYLAASLCLLGWKQELAIAAAVVATVVLFISVTLIEKQQSTEFDLLNSQVKDLKGKVDMLLLNKGFGR